MRRRIRRVLTTLWPAFFCACVLELVVFAFVDPEAMHDLHGLPLVDAGASGAMNSLTVQSLAFLFFWAAVTAAILTSRWLDSPGRPSLRDNGDTPLASRVADQG